MPSIYAVGTYSKGLAVYLEPQPHTLCYLDGQKGGITQIKFSHDGTKLLAGGRKDNEILIWDMRNPGRLNYTNLTLRLLSYFMQAWFYVICELLFTNILLRTTLRYSS